jgi:hypothetical protein
MRGEYFATRGSKLAASPLSTAAMSSASVGSIYPASMAEGMAGQKPKPKSFALKKFSRDAQY